MDPFCTQFKKGMFIMDEFIGRIMTTREMGHYLSMGMHLFERTVSRTSSELSVLLDMNGQPDYFSSMRVVQKFLNF